MTNRKIRYQQTNPVNFIKNAGHKLGLLALLLTSVALRAVAFVKVPDILSDGMVLQRDAPVPIWGTALPGEAILVRFQHQEKATTADSLGKWMVELDPMAADSMAQTLDIIGINHLRIKNVVIGEVWLCAGQSNMQLILSSTDKGDSVIAAATHPMLHFFNVSRENAFGHTRGAIGTWAVSSPASVKAFSAAAYYFGLALQKKLGVPVAVINSSFGGSQAEAWTPRSYLKTAELYPCIERDKLWASQRAAVQKQYTDALGEWRLYAAEQRSAGNKVKEAPHEPEALRDYRPAASIYTKMIAPFIPFGIKGIIWYQGESNEERAEQYGYLLPVMIRAWRNQWQKNDLPFGIVQLPNYHSLENLPEDGAWSHIREAQKVTADTVKNVGLIVTIDIGEAHNIHPHNKSDVGRRMCLWALGSVYHYPVLYSGPVFEHIGLQKNKIIIDYKSQPGGTLRTKDGQAPRCFAIAGADRRWYWAEAKITGKQRVTVWSKNVPEPVAVRYAFNNNPGDVNLTNDSKLPAGPFRTDKWSGPTTGRR